jgi:hypothetical protein
LAIERASTTVIQQLGAGRLAAASPRRLLAAARDALGRPADRPTEAAPRIDLGPIEAAARAAASRETESHRQTETIERGRSGRARGR